MTHDWRLDPRALAKTPSALGKTSSSMGGIGDIGIGWAVGAPAPGALGAIGGSAPVPKIAGSVGYQTEVGAKSATSVDDTPTGISGGASFASKYLGVENPFGGGLSSPEPNTLICSRIDPSIWRFDWRVERQFEKSLSNFD